MKKKLPSLFTVALFCSACCLGQVTDSLPTEAQPPVIQLDTILSDTLPSTVTSDSAAVAKPRLLKKWTGKVGHFFADGYPDPKKAMYLSLVVPGAGQLYNKRWWKVPIVWGGFAGLVYAADYNTRGYRIFQEAYLAELNNEPHQFTGRGLNSGDLKRYRDKYDKNKQLSYIGMFILHLFQATDAFVDAHLRTFDISDDISLQLAPSMQCSPIDYSPSFGFGASFSFGK